MFPCNVFVTLNILLLSSSEAFSELIQRSKKELFVKIVDGQKPLTVFKKRSILDVSLDSKSAHRVSIL